MSSETEFVGADANLGSGKDKNPLSFDFIVLEHVRHVLKLTTNDWSGGYFTNKVTNINGSEFVVETWSESRADAYVHAVVALYDVLEGYIDGSSSSAYQVFVDEVRSIDAEISDYLVSVDTMAVDRMRVMSMRVRRARAARGLFRGLMKTLKDSNYLKSGGYEEGLEE